MSVKTVTVDEGQGYANWYQNVESNDVYHHVTFERNRSVNVQIQANNNAFDFSVVLKIT